jgi:hypothetical protein
MAFAFEGYATAEFSGSNFSCAGGLAPDLTAYIPALLPNTTVIASPIVRNVLTNPGPDCVVNLGGGTSRVGSSSLLRSAHTSQGTHARAQALHTPARCHPAVLSDHQAAVVDGGHPGWLPGGRARAHVHRVPRCWAPRASLTRRARLLLTSPYCLSCVPSSVVWSVTHCKLVLDQIHHLRWLPEAEAQYTSTAMANSV